MQLPSRQPARALVVVLSYVVVVTVAGVGLGAAFGNIGLIYAGFVAAIGLLVVALCAPMPRMAPEPSVTAEPVLRRPRPPRGSS